MNEVNYGRNGTEVERYETSVDGLDSMESSFSDFKTYRFSDDLLPYLSEFKGKRPYTLLFKGKEIPVKDWNDFYGYISAALHKYAPEWLKRNASRYGWFSLSGIELDDVYLHPSVTNAFNAIRNLRSMLSDAGISLADVSVVYGEKTAGSRKHKAYKDLVARFREII